MEPSSAFRHLLMSTLVTLPTSFLAGGDAVQTQV